MRGRSVVALPELSVRRRGVLAMIMTRGSIAAVVSTAIVVSAGPAGAQVSSDDAKCRATFQKALTKYNAAIHKVTAGCWKSVRTTGSPRPTSW